MFGHHYFGAHYFGPHYFGPAVADAGSGSGEEPGTGGGGVADPCDVTYLVDGSCPPPSTAGAVIVGPQGPQGPPGEACDWCCPIYCDVDSPEGVLDGEIGAIYEQINAAITTHPLWVKRDNDGGNTGWRGWGGLRGEAAGSFAIGDNSVASGIDSIAFGEDAQATGLRAEAFGKSSIASADDAKAFGSGATVSAARGIAFGAGATVTGIEGISVGDGIAVNPNDVILGWSHVTAAAVAKPNIVIGFDNTIPTALDPSATTPSLYGGHVLIGYQATVAYNESNWHNIAMGYQAKADGRAIIAIGDLAQSRVSPTGGIGIGVFGTIIGYAAKGSGGCIVAVGDQCDVRGDNSVAIGTHTRANYHSTSAVGPNCFAGGLTGVDGGGAIAYGISCQATGQSSLAFGASNVVRAEGAHAFAGGAFINTLFKGSLAFGSFPSVTAPESIMFFDNGSNGGHRVRAIHFNGAAKPAIMITLDGKLQFMSDMLETESTRVFPITASITLDAVDTNLFVSTTSGNRVLQLPPSASVPIGKKYFIRRETAGANTLRVLPDGAETIDGDPNIDWALIVQYSWVVIENTGDPGFEWTIDDDDQTP